MTKITTDFVGSETIAVTKQRLTDILAYWGASTAAYTTWGQARTALNALLTSTTAGTIGSTELAGSFLPKINFLNDPDDMIADALFGAGEQGVWLDPSDVANVAWRRNLLLQTEGFGDVVWANNLFGAWTNATVTANTDTAPDGTLTADTIAITSSVRNRMQVISVTPNASYTFSLYAKGQAANTYGSGIYLRAATGLNGALVSLAHAITRVDTTLSDSVYTRFSVSFTIPSSGVNQISVGLTGSGDAPSPTANIYTWGAQLELGSTATEYQPITDLNTEVIERFPNATMYQDAAGTVPVYAPGQPVGLRLDKSKGLVLGSELVVNGDASAGTSGWTAAGANLTIASGAFSVAATAGYGSMQRSVIDTGAKTWLLTFQIVSETGSNQGAVNVYDTGFNNNASVAALRFGVGTHRIVIRQTGLSLIYFMVQTAGQTVVFDNISVKELPGNHAVQYTLGSRPMYGIEPKGGRRNLLTWSEDYSNAAWVKQDATIAANAIAAPDGSLTADLVTGTGATPRFYQLAAPLVNGATYTITAYAKQGTSPSVRFDFINISDGPTFTFATKSWGSLPAAFTSVGVEELANGWFRLRATALCSNNSGGPGFATSGSNTVYLWGAQLELGSTATPYQRVTTAFDVTEAGVNSCHYCQYDGSDDGMVTNSIDFTATDKMSVFAGVRKLSTGFATMVELGPIINSTAGTVWLGTNDASLQDFAFGSSGSSATYAVVDGYNSPTNNILTGLGDISGDRTTLRVNGVQVAQDTGNQGTGNYSNLPINIGRRGNNQPTPTIPFNGRDYGIIVTGKLANATAIATTEMWLANKTAGVTL